MRRLLSIIIAVATAPFMIICLREMDRLERICNSCMDDGSDEHNQTWLSQVRYLESCLDKDVSRTDRADRE